MLVTLKSGSVCQMSTHLWFRQHGQLTAMQGAAFVLRAVPWARARKVEQNKNCKQAVGSSQEDPQDPGGHPHPSKAERRAGPQETSILWQWLSQKVFHPHPHPCHGPYLTGHRVCRGCSRRANLFKHLWEVNSLEAELRVGRDGVPGSF